MIDFVHRRKLWYLISLIVITPGLIALIVWHLNLGIDFTGGAEWELQFPRTDIQSLDVRQVLIDQGFVDPLVQIASGTAPGSQDVIMRVKSLDQGSAQKNATAQALKNRFGDYTELRLDTVGPTVGRSVSKNSILSVLAASI